MADLYFSERESGPRPRNQEQITEVTWGGIIAIVNSLMNTEAFGADFPDSCPDGAGNSGLDKGNFSLMLHSEIPELQWPLSATVVQPLPIIMDLIEFCYRYVAKPTSLGFHPYFGHNHYTYDREEGQSDFRQRINRLFARNGVAYDLQDGGQIVRLAPAAFQVILHLSFDTGDSYLDAMLEAAKTKYLSPNPVFRQEALEKLWDAWERLKTVEAIDKKDSVRILLDRASSQPAFRGLLEEEARKLTDIGNAFMIRHSEMTKTPIQSDEHADYLFQRMFALIHLLLKTRGSIKATMPGNDESWF